MPNVPKSIKNMMRFKQCGGEIAAVHQYQAGDVTSVDVITCPVVGIRGVETSPPVTASVLRMFDSENRRRDLFH